MKKIIFSIVGVITVGLCHGQTVFINELHYDNSGGDLDELVEVAGPAGTDLTGWTIALYNGSNGEVYRTISLSGTIPDQQAGFGTVSFLEAGMQNGPDGLALVDQNESVIQFLSYEGVFSATDGPAIGLNSEELGVAETNATPVGHSLQLVGAGTTYAHFSWNEPSLGSAGNINPGQDFSVVGSPPEITCPLNIEEETQANLCEAIINFDLAIATDLEDGSLPVLQTMGPPSGSAFPVGETIIEFSAVDSDNNIVSCQFSITVIDATPPVMDCPKDQTVSPGRSDLMYLLPDYWAEGLVTATDNCTDPLTLTSQDPPAGTQMPEGVHTITFNAEDEYGNLASCDFKLTVIGALGIQEEYGADLLIYQGQLASTLFIHNPGMLSIGGGFIYTMTGILVEQFTLDPLTLSHSIDLTPLARATYILVLNGAHGRITRRFTKN